MTLVRFRVDLPGGHAIGPGKVRLLELLDQHGSISAAARAMRMSYRQAWILLNDLNDCFGQRLFETATGGRKGGGARLTPLGRRVVERYGHLSRAIDSIARRTLRGLIGPTIPVRKESQHVSGSAQGSGTSARKRRASGGGPHRKRLARHAASSRTGRRP